MRRGYLPNRIHKYPNGAQFGFDAKQVSGT